jgi:hypothetical protein
MLSLTPGEFDTFQYPAPKVYAWSFPSLFLSPLSFLLQIIISFILETQNPALFWRHGVSIISPY